MGDWAEAAARLEALLRLKTYPIALKFFEKAEELSRVEGLRRPRERLALCQVISQCRTIGRTIGVTTDDMFCAPGATAVGLLKPSEDLISGRAVVGIYHETPEDARKMQQATPRVPIDRFEALAFSPLARGRLQPDMIIIYGNSAQMMRLIQGFQWSNYERFQFTVTGEFGICGDGIAQCYLTGKPSLVIPGYGDRRFGNDLDDELAMCIPVGMLEKTIVGLEKTGERLRYPIAFFGAEIYPSALFEPYRMEEGNKRG